MAALLQRGRAVRRWLGICAAAAAVLVALLVWWMTQRTARDVAPLPAPPAATASAPPIVAKPEQGRRPAAVANQAPPASSPLPPALRDRSRRLPEVYAELLRLAGAGSVEAMHELSARLYFCTPGHRQALELALMLERERGLPPNADAGLRENRAQYLAAQQRRIDDCAAVPADAPSSLDWLQRAGEMGYGPAQLDYVQQALAEYAGSEADAIADRIEEILRRRDLARRFMAEAMTHCVPGALQVQVANAQYLFDATDTQAHRIAHAAAAAALWRETAAANGDADHVANLQGDVEHLMRGLDEVSRATALRQGEAMYNSCAPR